MKRVTVRILYIIPITLSIIWFSLFLFYKLPQKTILDTERIQLGNSSDYYNLLSSAVHIDNGRVDERMPLFYASVLQSSVPGVFYNFPIPFRRSFKNMCYEVGNREAMELYGRWLIDKLEALTASGAGEMSSEDLLSLLNCDNWEDFEHLTAEIAVPDNIREALVPQGGEPAVIIPYYLRWHGKENIFHRQLELLFTGSKLISDDGTGVYRNILRSVSWTICYSIPGLIIAFSLAFIFVLQFHPVFGNKKILPFFRGSALALYSMPTFVIATLALVFLTSGRYGLISTLFPFPDFYRTDAGSLISIWTQHSASLLLPIFVFAINPGVALFRLFDEKVNSLWREGKEGGYLLHLGLSKFKVKFKYLASYLVVTILGAFSNLFIGMIAGSLVIEIVFNIPGLGRLFYNSIVELDINTSITLIVLFTILHQVGHIFSDWMIDRFLSDGKIKNLLV